MENLDIRADINCSHNYWGIGFGIAALAFFLLMFLVIVMMITTGPKTSDVERAYFLEILRIIFK